MNQRHRRQLETIDRHIRQLERLKTLAGHAWHACELTLPDGYPGGGTERTSGGDTSRPTEASYLAIEGRIESREGDDEARRVGMAAVENSLAVIGGAITQIHAELSILAAPLTRTDPPKRTNMVDCQACDRPVANTPDDRLRSGYCTACYHSWRRQGMPDRPHFERMRAKHNGDAARVAMRDDGTGAKVTLAVNGLEVTLPPHLEAEYLALDMDAQRDQLGRFHEAAVAWWEQQASTQ